MTVYCSVDNCYSKVGIDGLSFFRCPKDEERCKKWKMALGFKGNHRYANITPEQCNKRIKICSLHFTNDSFTCKFKNQLTPMAVPSLNLDIQADNASTSAGVNAGKILVDVKSFSDANIQTEDFYPHEILQKTPDPTPTHHNDELEPNIDLGPESSSKRKREEEFERTLSDSRENDAQPSTSQTIEEIDRPLISTKSYISYKQKYKELLDAYKKLEQQFFHLKNNTDKNKKSRGTFSVIPSSSTVVKRTRFDHVQMRHSQEEIEELGKQWTGEFSHLSAEQQVYTKEAISEIFDAAKMNNLHSKSVKINDVCLDIVSVKTDDSEIDIFDEHLTSTSKGFGATSVKTEDRGKGIYDDPSTPENVEFGVSVKTEESELDFDTISVKTEETHNVYDENDYKYNQYKTVNFIPDDIYVSVKPEEAELYEKNSDMSDNRCLLRINEDYRDGNLTSNEIEIYDDHEDDVIKIEKDEII